MEIRHYFYYYFYYDYHHSFFIIILSFLLLFSCFRTFIYTHILALLRYCNSMLTTNFPPSAIDPLVFGLITLTNTLFSSSNGLIISDNLLGIQIILLSPILRILTLYKIFVTIITTTIVNTIVYYIII